MASETDSENEIIVSEVKKRRKNEAQTEYLIAYMEEHKAFACGRFVGTNAAQDMKQQWMRLTMELNSRGYPKSIDRWQRTWIDLKRNSRKNYINYKKTMNATGSNKENVPKLNKQDRRVIDIVGKLCTGLGIPEDGFSNEYKRKHEVMETGHDSYSLERSATRPRTPSSTIQTHNHNISDTSQNSSAPCHRRVSTLNLPFDGTFLERPSNKESVRTITTAIDELTDAVREHSSILQKATDILDAFLESHLSVFEENGEENDAGLQ